jgi:hypothetical protein
MHIADCIELYLAHGGVKAAFTTQLEQTQESQLGAAGTSEGALKGWDARGRKVVTQAQKKGYTIKDHGRFSDYRGKPTNNRWVNMEHPSGHKLVVNNDGRWEHEMARDPYTNSDYRTSGWKKSEVDRMRQSQEQNSKAYGRGQDMLEKRLKAVVH